MKATDPRTKVVDGKTYWYHLHGDQWIARDGTILGGGQIAPGCVACGERHPASEGCAYHDPDPTED